MRSLFHIVVLTLAVDCFAVSPNKNIFNWGQIGPLVEGRYSTIMYKGGVRQMENMLPSSRGPAVRRPGTKLRGPSALRYQAEFERSITWQYLCKNGAVMGIPYESSTEVLTFDANSRPRLVYNSATYQQDLIGIPLRLHPFVSGQKIYISSNGGAADFEGGWTVQPETTENEIVIKGQWTWSFWQGNWYSPSTFDGNETAYRYVTHSSSAGRMDVNSSGTLFVANSGEIAKISEDFLTVDLTYCVPDGGWPGGDTPIISGLELTDDGKYLYAIRISPGMWLFKFNTSDGSEVWRSDVNDGIWYHGSPVCDQVFPASQQSPQSYDIAVDAANSVYIISASSTPWAPCLGVPSNYGPADKNISKYLEDGTFIDFYLDYTDPLPDPLIPTIVPNPAKSPFADKGVYGVHVDDDMGLVIGGGGNWWSSTYPQFYTGQNLWARALDNTSGTSIQLGRDPQPLTGTIYTTDNWDYGGITTLDGYIFVSDPDNDTLYKLDTDLNVLDSTEISYINAVYPDIFGNLVVIRSAISGFLQVVQDCLWYYDTDLNYLGKSWFYNSSGAGTLQSWGGTGSSWMKGDWVFKEILPGEEIFDSNQGYDIYDVKNLYGNSKSEIRLIPFEYSTDDSYVLGFGDKFMQVYGRFFDFYEDFESDNLLYGGWITSGDAGLYTGIGSSNYIARMADDSSLTKEICPAGEQLYLTYKRGSRPAGGIVEYSIDGTNWTTIETVGNTIYSISETGFIFPYYVSSYPVLYLRFRSPELGGYYRRYLYVDDVYVTSEPLYSLKASNPSPADGATDVAVGENYWDFYTSWDENLFADSYDTYFGTTNPPPYVRNQSSEYFYTYYTLDYDTTYYWRIDTVSGVTITGDTWSFSTPDIVIPEGVYSAKSGDISHNESSILQFTETTSAGTIDFSYKVSSESDYDYFLFYIDDVEKDSWSGELPWLSASYAISAAEHTFKWVYEKDGSVSDGNDCGWIDDVNIPGTTDDFETGDFSVFTWVLSGDANWTIESTP